MINSYRSLHPNHVHQLTVAVSKHYFVTKSGSLKYQMKPLEVNLDKITSADRTHLIHYIIRDHFSGLIYYEFALSNNLTPIQSFLFNAWAFKKDYSFYGIPDLLMIPDTVESKFAGIREKVIELGISLVKVTSGFQGGIRDIKTIENCLGLHCNQPIEGQYLVEEICRYINKQKSRAGSITKTSLWRDNIKSIRVPAADWLNSFA